MRKIDVVLKCGLIELMSQFPDRILKMQLKLENQIRL